DPEVEYVDELRFRTAVPDADGAWSIGADERLLLVPAVTTVDRPLTHDDLELPDPVRRSVYAYLRERAPLTTELVVGQPDYHWVSVRARLIIRQRAGLDEVSRERRRRAIMDQAARRLYEFIHPVRGGVDGQGWPFGASLTLGDVYPLLQRDPEVEYVDELRFRTAVPDADGAWSIGADERLLRLQETELFCSAAHYVEVQEDGAST
ncbi:MAG: hypothetical protein JOY61_13470, partial [Chloroflexi bacterium]|nr:hypothetical protein [Chloroflexota bacterium]